VDECFVGELGCYGEILGTHSTADT
jgi:hypothetical protein